MRPFFWNKTAEIFAAEHERRILWLPVLFAAGILFYFSLPYEPSTGQTGLFLSLSGWGALLTRRRSRPLFYVFLCLAFIAAGFMTASFHARVMISSMVEKDLPVIWLRATVENIESREHGYRIIVKDPDIWRPETGSFPPQKTPARIRLIVRTEMKNVRPGDRIQTKAKLNPPAEMPAYPGGYDFARAAWFERIGAVGYTLSPVTVREEGVERSLASIVSGWRRLVSEKILAVFGETGQENGSIALALLTGEQGAIPKETIESMRISGLGHLLSVSGLHMALVMTTCFFAIRAFLALIPPIALRYPIKKWAALCALLLGLGYLLLTGMLVAAARAYIMAGLFFLAILLDRTGTPMRPVAWAAIIILLFWPQAITGPSFQMSFAAVIALIAAYEKYQSADGSRFSRSLLKRGLVYVSGVVFSSVIAGAATAPYAAYHFGRFSSYGLPANLLGVPLTSFWIMPLGVLGMALMPLGLEALALKPMGWGIAWLAKYSAWIAALPEANILLPQIQPLPILLFTFAGLWLCLWRGALRWLSLPLLAASIALALLPAAKPDIIVDGSGKLFALRANNSQLAFSSLTKARYARSEWLEADGQEKPLRLKDAVKGALLDYSCEEKNCLYSAAGGRVFFIHETPKPDAAICKDANMVINFTDAEFTCPENSSSTIGLPELRRQGTHVIWLGNNGVKLRTAGEAQGERLWTRNRARPNG